MTTVASVSAPPDNAPPDNVAAGNMAPDAVAADAVPPGTAPSGNMAADAAAPGNMAPDAAAPGNMAPDAAAPGNVAAGNVAPGNVAPDNARARAVAATVTDPELPMLTLADLGVLRDVAVNGGAVIVTITPTYLGCPAMATMRDDLVRRLRDSGYDDVRVQVSLSPAWSSDDITAHGRQVLAEHGISAPGPVRRADGPVELTLMPARRAIACPRCGAAEVELTSEFGPTACKALYRCTACLEPFEHVKEI